MIKPKIVVLGAGNFGTCLALHLARKGHATQIWARKEHIARAISEKHLNPDYLADQRLPDNLLGFSNFDALTSKIEILVVAVPTQFLRAVLPLALPYLAPDATVVSTVKGIEQNSLLFPSQLLAELGVLAKDILVLSGPSFAAEIAQQLPTALALAGQNQLKVKQIQSLFHTPKLRIYSNRDPVGLELSGALKNVIAIAAGACNGLGFQDNSKAALLTRGLAEIMRLGVTLGAKERTFCGLGGVGDLSLSCSSNQSRNFRVGFNLAIGRPLAEILMSLGSIAEGVQTARSVYLLAEKHKVDLPICSAVYRVLYENAQIETVFHDLIHREQSEE